LFPECRYECWASSHSTQRISCVYAELPQVLRAEIRQFMLLPMAPYILDWIKLRGIRGKKFEFQPAPCFIHEIPHYSASMTPESIPNYEKLSRNMPHQVRKKFDNLRTSDRPGKQSKVEGPQSNASYGRERLPVEVILKHRCLPPRRPGPASMRPLAQATLVDENYCLCLLLGFFLSSGQRFFFHWRIAFSLRSNARPVGLWQLHPRSRSTFQTCPGWYLIPHSRSIKSATLHAVHRLVSYPRDSGPRLRADLILPKSSLVSRRLRPARPAFLSPATPDSAKVRAQRLTDCRCAPTRRATSASWIPCFKSFAACKRRASSASKFRFTPAGFPMHKSILDFSNNVTILCGTQ